VRATSNAAAGRTALDPLLLGIDVGTTFCKAVIVTPDGREVAHARERTPWFRVAAGQEMGPAAVLATALDVAAAAIQAAPDGPIVAVGVTGLAETGVLLDAAGRPVVPGISWFDPRGTEDAAALAAERGADWFSSHTGLPLGPLPTVFKYRWLRRNDPSAARGRRWLNVEEWIVRGLGGDEVAEASLASRTGWLDQSTGGWWADGLAWADAPADLLPRLVQAGDLVGRVTPGLLPRADGAALTVAGHDHLCVALGVGAMRPGDVLNSCGTTEALIRAVPAPQPVDRILAFVHAGLAIGRHVVPGEQALMCGSLCGPVLDRFADLLGVDAAGRAGLDAAALAVPSGAGGLTVRDGAGERATLAGIGQDVTPGLVWRAAHESIQAETRRLLEILEAAVGPTGRLVAAGGGIRDPLIRSIKGEIVGPFEAPPVGEAGARGAALLSGCAAGIFPDVHHLPPPGSAAPAWLGLPPDGHPAH